MSTHWSWTPSQARALTSIDANTVSMQPAPLPTVHHHSMKNVGGNSGDTPAKMSVQSLVEKEVPASNNKKRKSDGPDSVNDPDRDGGGGTAKKPRTGRKKSDGGSTKASDKKSQAEALLDVSSIHLDEDGGPVPVYETCDSIRRMVREILKKDGVTQAGFCRALAQATTSLDKPPQATQLNRFLNNKGPLGGNTSSVFYASYVLFEKMRIRDGKPKSKFRQEMEEKHGEEGVDIDHNASTQYLTLHVTERASYDKYGMLHITKGHSHN